MNLCIIKELAMYAKYRTTELHKELATLLRSVEMGLGATHHLTIMAFTATLKAAATVMRLVFYHPRLVRKRGPTEWEEVETYKAHVTHYMTPPRF